MALDILAVDKSATVTLATQHFGTATSWHPDTLPPRPFATPDFLPPRHFTTQTFCHPDFFPHQIFLHIKRGRAKPDRVGPCVELKKLKKLKNKPEVIRFFFLSIVSSVDTGAVP